MRARRLLADPDPLERGRPNAHDRQARGLVPRHAQPTNLRRGIDRQRASCRLLLRAEGGSVGAVRGRRGRGDVRTEVRIVVAHLLVALSLTMMLAMAASAQESPVYLDSTRPIDARVDDLFKQLTVEEKISLVHANSKFTTAGIARLGIPTRWLSDGPHGVREEMAPH